MTNSNKPEIVRVNLSTPFMVRTKCKRCQGAPMFYYYIRNPTMWLDPKRFIKQFDWLKSLVTRFVSEVYLKSSPKNYHSVSVFAHGMTYTKYRPRLHRTRGCNPVFDVVEILTCDCMQTAWAFANKAVVNRPEIHQRKARYRYPHKFEF